MKRFQVTAKPRDGYPGIGCNGRQLITGVPVILTEDEIVDEIHIYAHLLEIVELPEEKVIEAESVVITEAAPAPKATVKTTRKRSTRR